MKRYSLTNLLCAVGAFSIVLACFVRFPGVSILLASFVPLMLVFRYFRPRGSRKELKLMLLLAIAVMPAYLAAGPVITRGA